MSSESAVRLLGGFSLIYGGGEPVITINSARLPGSPRRGRLLWRNRAGLRRLCFAGRTIFIPAGEYVEGITLDKAVSLVGAGKTALIRMRVRLI